MIVTTGRFGAVAVSRKDIFEVTAPIPGFPNTESFFFLRREEIAPFWWLQSSQEPWLTLLVVEPRHYFRYYSPGIRQSDLADVGAAGADEVELYVIITLPEDTEKMTANLRRPIIVNRATGKMKQVRRSFEEYSFTESVVEGIKRGESARADIDRFEIYLN